MVVNSGEELRTWAAEKLALLTFGNFVCLAGWRKLDRHDSQRYAPHRRVLVEFGDIEFEHPERLADLRLQHADRRRRRSGRSSDVGTGERSVSCANHLTGENRRAGRELVFAALTVTLVLEAPDEFFDLGGDPLRPSEMNRCRKQAQLDQAVDIGALHVSALLDLLKGEQLRRVQLIEIEPKRSHSRIGSGQLAVGLDASGACSQEPTSFILRSVSQRSSISTSPSGHMSWVKCFQNRVVTIELRNLGGSGDEVHCAKPRERQYHTVSLLSGTEVGMGTEARRELI